MFQFCQTSDTLTRGTRMRLIKPRLVLEQHFSEGSVFLIQSHPKVFSAVSVLEMALLLSFACDAKCNVSSAERLPCKASNFNSLPALCVALRVRPSDFSLFLSKASSTKSFHGTVSSSMTTFFFISDTGMMSGLSVVGRLELPVAGPRSPDGPDWVSFLAQALMKLMVRLMVF